MKENKIEGQLINFNSVFGNQVFNIEFGVRCIRLSAITPLTKTLRRDLNNIEVKLKVSVS